VGRGNGGPWALWSPAAATSCPIGRRSCRATNVWCALPRGRAAWPSALEKRRCAERRGCAAALCGGALARGRTSSEWDSRADRRGVGCGRKLRAALERVAEEEGEARLWSFWTQSNAGGTRQADRRASVAPSGRPPTSAAVRRRARRSTPCDAQPSCTYAAGRGALVRVRTNGSGYRPARRHFTSVRVTVF